MDPIKNIFSGTYTWPPWALLALGSFLAGYVEQGGLPTLPLPHTGRLGQTWQGLGAWGLETKTLSMFAM
jgi:hypothetical protein